MNPENVKLTVVIVLAIVALVEFAFIIIQRRDATERAERDRKGLREAYDDNTKLTTELTRETEVSGLLARILGELAHSDNGFSISWKLQTIRMVEKVLQCHGYEDNAVYEWLRDTLTTNACETRDQLLDKVHNIIFDYYAMDMDQGENLYEVLRQLIILQDKNPDGVTNLMAARRQLDDAISILKFKLPIVEASSERPEAVPEITTMDQALEHLENEYQKYKEDNDVEEGTEAQEEGDRDSSEDPAPEGPVGEEAVATVVIPSIA